MRDLGGHPVIARSERQLGKLRSLRRTYPERLLVLGQDDEGTILFSVRFALLHGGPDAARAGRVTAAGELRWLSFG